MSNATLSLAAFAAEGVLPNDLASMADSEERKAQAFERSAADFLARGNRHYAKGFTNDAREARERAARFRRVLA